jgi:hypothetical protein
MAQAAAGLAQMRVGLAVLTETKLVDDRYPKTASGYSIMSSKAVSGHQGGVALMWKEDGPAIRGRVSAIQQWPQHCDLPGDHGG